MPSGLKVVAGKWYDCTEESWNCPPDCDDVDGDCGHVELVALTREVELTFEDGSEGFLVPFGIDDFDVEFSSS